MTTSEKFSWGRGISLSGGAAPQFAFLPYAIDAMGNPYDESGNYLDIETGAILVDGNGKPITVDPDDLVGPLNAAAPGTDEAVAKAKAINKVSALSTWSVSQLAAATSFHELEPTWATDELQDNRAYGGVIIDDSGRMLLRKPSDTEDGDETWTFAKGGKDSKYESEGAAALREAIEETGYACDIVGVVPGSYRAGRDTHLTFMFLMRPVDRDSALMDDETEKVKWFSFKDAWVAINRSAKKKRRRRDMEIFKAALKALVAYLDGKRSLSDYGV